MRKLVLFGLLGGVFGLALLLERFVTRPAVKVDADSDQLSLVIGGGTPRELPEIPDAPPPEAGGGGGRKGDPRPGGRPAGGGARGGNEAIAKQRPPSPAPKPDGADEAGRRVEEPSRDAIGWSREQDLGTTSRRQQPVQGEGRKSRCLAVLAWSHDYDRAPRRPAVVVES